MAVAVNSIDLKLWRIVSRSHLVLLSAVPIILVVDIFSALERYERFIAKPGVLVSAIYMSMPGWALLNSVLILLFAIILYLVGELLRTLAAGQVGPMAKGIGESKMFKFEIKLNEWLERLAIAIAVIMLAVVFVDLANKMLIDTRVSSGWWNVILSWLRFSSAKLFYAAMSIYLLCMLRMIRKRGEGQ